jgi:hypothetical protein
MATEYSQEEEIQTGCKQAKRPEEALESVRGSTHLGGLAAQSWASTKAPEGGVQDRSSMATHKTAGSIPDMVGAGKGKAEDCIFSVKDGTSL